MKFDEFERENRAKTPEPCAPCIKEPSGLRPGGTCVIINEVGQAEYRFMTEDGRLVRAEDMWMLPYD